MGNEFSTQSNKRKWQRVSGVYDTLGKRLQIQKQIDKLNIQFDELTDSINKEKVNLQRPTNNNVNNNYNNGDRQNDNDNYNNNDNNYNDTNNVGHQTGDNSSNIAIKDGVSSREPMRDDTLLHNSLLYSPTISRME